MDNGVSVFIPLYNEESILQSNVLAVRDYLLTLGIPFEIILGSNGSTDRTREIGEMLAASERRVQFFHLPERGPGRAFREALRRVRYRSIVTLDADLSFEMDFVRTAVHALNEHDVVIGSKGRGNQERAWHRVWASNAYIWLTNLLLRMPYRDYAIGAKGYSTSAILPFVNEIDPHTFYTQQLVFLLWKQGGKIVEVPVKCEDKRSSRFNLLHEAYYRYAKLLRLWCRNLRK